MENQTVFRRPYPTIKQAWILFLIIIAMNIGASFLVLPFQKSAPDLGFFLAYVVGMGAAYFVARKLKKGDEGQVVHSFQFGNWVTYPLLLAITWACLLLLMPVVEIYPPPGWLEEIIEELIDTTSVWAFMSLVVAAPILEEIVFRGIILDGFLKQYSPKKSILWSSFFFGLIHLNPWQFVTAMGLGIFIGWVYHRTRSLLPCIAIHAFANGTSFFLSANLSEEQQDMTLVENLGGIGPLLLTLVVAGVLVYIGIKMFNRTLPQPPVETDPAPDDEMELL